MKNMDENISVEEFERKENSLVHMVFDGENMVFPTDDLNLNGMMISYDKRK